LNNYIFNKALASVNKPLCICLLISTPSTSCAFELNGATASVTNDAVPKSNPSTIDLDVKSARRNKLDLNLNFSHNNYNADILLSKQRSNDSYNQRGKTIAIAISRQIDDTFLAKAEVIKKDVKYDSFYFALQYPTTDFQQNKFSLQAAPNSKSEIKFSYSWTEGSRTISDIYLEKGVWTHDLEKLLRGNNNGEFMYLEFSPVHKAEDKALSYLYRITDNLRLNASVGEINIENKSQWLSIAAIGCVSDCVSVNPEFIGPYVNYSRTFAYKDFSAEYDISKDMAISFKVNDFDGFKTKRYKLAYLLDENISSTAEYNETLNSFGLTFSYKLQ
jgi:hypothetical protein